MTEIKVGTLPGVIEAPAEHAIAENQPSVGETNPFARSPLADEIKIGQSHYSITIAPVAVAPTFVKVTVRCQNANRVLTRMWYEFAQTGPEESLRAVRSLLLSGETFEPRSLPPSNVTHWPKVTFQSRIKALLFGSRLGLQVKEASGVAMHSSALDAR